MRTWVCAEQSVTVLKRRSDQADFRAIDELAGGVSSALFRTLSSIGGVRASPLFLFVELR